MASLQKTGLLLSSNQAAAWESFQRTTGELLNAGHRVYGYFLHEGVRQLYHPLVPHLIQRGLHLHVCSLGAESRAIPFRDQAIFCGLGTLASVIRDTDSFYSFSSHSPAFEQKGKKKEVWLITSETLEDKAGNTLESLRVAAGLAQLSDLVIHLSIEGKASLLFAESFSTNELREEAFNYLRLLNAARGTLHLPLEAAACPIPFSPGSGSSESEEKLFLELG